MPITRTAERSTNYQVNGLRLRRSGLVSAVGPAPAFIAVGAQSANTVAFTVAWPARHQAQDLGILVLETSGDDSTVTPSGWKHISGSPVVDIADATGSKLQILWKFAASDEESSVSVVDPGDHGIARIFVFRGVRSDIAPGRVSATDTKTAASTSVTWPGVTIVSPNSTIICVATRPDDSSSTTAFSAFANADLTGVAEAGEGGSTAGNGGGFVLNYGTRAAIGSVGTSTGTMTVSVTNAVITFALEPSVALPA